MNPETTLLVALLMGLGAALYTSVGHAGASAYLAIMALFAIPATTMRPTALVLNILVASFTTIRFVRAGQFDFRLFWPFVLGAVPAAFVAGMMALPPAVYRPVLATILLIAGLRLLWPSNIRALVETKRPALPIALLSGVGIGTLSGLTGTGGGIFLSPLLLFFGWTSPRIASGVAAAFILCVSISGLLGNLSSVGQLPAELPWFVLAVAMGAVIGTSFGIARLPNRALLRLLGAVLLVASAKLAFT